MTDFIEQLKIYDEIIEQLYSSYFSIYDNLLRKNGPDIGKKALFNNPGLFSDIKITCPKYFTENGDFKKENINFLASYINQCISNTDNFLRLVEKTISSHNYQPKTWEDAKECALKHSSVTPVKTNIPLLEPPRYTRFIIEQAKQAVTDARLNGTINHLLATIPADLQPLYYKINRDHDFFEKFHWK